MDQSQVFLKISIAGAQERKVIITLYTKECPITCENFLRLCSSKEKAKRPHKSSLGKSSSPCPATYRNTEFHRIMPGFMVQGGDYQNFDGTGGGSVINNGGTFEDESFDILHDREGVLSMANKGPNTNGSQFFITLTKTPHLDNKHVAFGHVTYGIDVIRDMAKVETETNSNRPIMLERVIITDCGVVPLGSRSINKATIGEEENIELKSKKHRKYEKHKKHRKHKRERKTSRSRRENNNDHDSDSYNRSSSEESSSTYEKLSRKKYQRKKDRDKSSMHRKHSKRRGRDRDPNTKRSCYQQSKSGSSSESESNENSYRRQREKKSSRRGHKKRRKDTR